MTARAFAFLVVAAIAATNLSCNVNDYCLHCATDDAGLDGGSGDGDGGADDDGGGIDAGCTPSGAEECDGKDNDCNGLVDDGALPQVGQLCAVQTGECAGGTNQCVNGKLECSKKPSPETCDGKDNNCNGTPDEGDPGGGAKCGTDMGECVAGQYRCNAQTGMVECVGFIDYTMAPELCDAKDNDCDGKFDENIGSLGNCGPATNDGECVIGTLACQGGAPVCQNAVFPKFETCNNLDDDCDTRTDEIFNKNTDPRNCGNCGVVCPAQPNANTLCAMGACGYACKPGYHDLNPGGGANAGCEYGPCFASGVEECDGADNDCDNKIDEGLNPPSICRSGGECGATAPAPTCNGAGGWTCTYPGEVQFPETRCDGKNNDCDANIDEGQANLGLACDDGRQGECRGTGVFACSAQAPDGPAICNVTQPGQTSPAAQETCDDKDNDCDGGVDEGSETGNLLGQEWVDIGNGKKIMKYEASRFDATSTQQGNAAAVVDVPIAAAPTGATQSGAVATFTTQGNHSLAVGRKVRVNGVGISGYNGLWTVASVPSQTRFTATLATSGLAPSGGGFVAKYKGACSKQGVLPWTNVTYVEALAACESMGASLCSETRWHQACSVVPPVTTPVSINAASGTTIEAEDFTNNVVNGSPETGTQCSNNTDDDTDGRINDGCPSVVTGVGPETGGNCANATDDDNDGRANDGCPTAAIGNGPETGTQCNNNSDDDGDGRDNDGCPTFELGAGPETGGQCNNNTDDDGDGRDNDGCPTVGNGPETGTQCNNNSDNDSDGRDNDGCPATSAGAGPETGTQCNNNSDDDGDGRDNDGCPATAIGAGPETGTACENTTDNDNDAVINDGCPAVERSAETATQCANNTDDDGDGRINDGCSSGAQAWSEDYTTDDVTTAVNEQHSGIGNMRALPNTGASIPAGSALASSPRLDYSINIPTSANDWRVHVRMFSPTNTDDTLRVAVGPTVAAPTQTLVTSSSGQWVWMSTGAMNLSSGTNTLSLFMGDDGLKVDRIFIVRGGVTPPSSLGSAGGTWSYATNATTYQATVCNGADRTAGNDDVLPSGSLASCYADHAGANDVYDMSGNVKEWTLARLPGQNPIRGGASNDLASGISCALNFTLGSDTFFFPNVGFRCCK